MTSIVTSSTEVTAGDRAVGTIGLVCAAGVAVILGVHPFGTTDVYDDGQQFRCSSHLRCTWRETGRFG